ncbi:hypothetical protein ABGB17_03280 [Sphaerisporangium sp. B11E5]|uniref:hypothetical protein n=1 Tax=Sphaerisporangium sp. B11E5 TaxID=3153563 RepID=UPI00325DAD3A
MGKLLDRPAPDLTPDRVPAGQPVIVRGMGAGLPTLLTALTEGRGGTFTRDGHGRVAYLPGGAEPVIHLGSGRGVPYRAAIRYPLVAAPVPAPRFATPGKLPRRTYRWRREVWPLVAKDLAYAYYHELLNGHPGRVRMTWAEFATAYAAEEWDSKAMRALIRRAVPHFADRLNLSRVDRPLDGIKFGDAAGLRRWMHGYLDADLTRRTDRTHSPDLALAVAARTLRDHLGEPHGDPWLDGFTRFVGDGPPPTWLPELQALATAGVVLFLGANLQVRPDEHGTWRAAGTTLPGGIQTHIALDIRGITEKQEEYR